MPFRSLLRRFRDRSTVVHECRNCGVTVANDTKRCPECGTHEIGQYHLT
jgi:rubrerythrin